MAEFPVTMLYSPGQWPQAGEHSPGTCHLDDGKYLVYICPKGNQCMVPISPNAGHSIHWEWDRATLTLTPSVKCWKRKDQLCSHFVITKGVMRET